ncbi:transmembrane protein 245 [Tribolium castaneum]|uniref:Transmembrane protein 245-like Protein n=1 Tax=Tribolium castaneum TaxID=7070 RepID=D6WSG9_TRICA|nr:PREDICTED: transmembrane protein 245 [Tribolium castaneum]EFA06639.1 Transmembrane protein 245-like Protein [Tribolium castaneum]|eukprot:XP_973506.1 PREDICTED: transmembrane protein 245 [Tribolium castaneum]
MDHRSPLESIFGIIGGLPQGHDKPVKHALYNAVALLLLFLCCAASWALFMILEPFVKPLIWALLVGSVLHPLKRSLRDKFQAWFKSLEVSHTPIVLGVMLIPINIVNDLSDLIGDQILKRIKFIIAVCVAVPLVLLVYNYTPKLVVCIFYKAYTYSYFVLGFCLDNASLPLFGLILIAYMSLTFLLWKPENNTRFHYASIGIWLLLSCCLAHLFGSFQMAAFIFLQVVFFGGFVSEVYDIHNELNAEGHSITFFESLSLAFHDKSLDIDEEHKEPANEASEQKSEPLEDQDAKPKTSVKFNDGVGDGAPVKSPRRDPYSLDLFEENKSNLLERTDSELSNASVLITNQGIHLISKTPKKELKRSLSQPQFSLKNRSSFTSLNRRLSSVKSSTQSLIDTEKYESTFYLYSVLWACIVMLFWKNIVLLPLLPLPILLYCLKHAGKYFGVWNWLYDKLKIAILAVSNWCCERHDALVPVPIRGLYRVVHKINIFLKTSIRESIDTVASCVVIFGLIIFVTCASVFIAIQIYAEAIMMVQMTGNVINQTVVHNPELRQLLPPAWDDTVDSILDNAYQYGREGISKAVKGMMTDVDSAKSEKLEKQVLELWDRVYQSWMSTTDANGPKVTEDAVRVSWENFISDIQRSPEMFNLNGIVDFAKQNVGTLLSLLESVWSIVKGNIGLVLGSFSAFLSVILGGGTAVLNFILNGIVFLTTLFYLLSSSGDLYKPVELMTKFSTSGRRFGHALEGAINGVFTASFKMAAFYGMWTWFIHNLFGVKIVYLPSAFATILGAVPFLGTYWACFPAVLDLWLAQDRGIEAIVFAIFQFLPTSIVDTTIYKEIKGGGHPYLTGLAIAGGIFCLGVEGAIVGPLLLCGLYVAIDLSSSLFKESPSEEPINLRLQLQDR